jgi:DNA polymerase III psi subunit
MEIEKINDAKIFVLGMDSSHMEDATEDIESLTSLIDDVIVGIEENITNIAVSKQRIKSEEVRMNSVFSSLSVTSSEVKNISENIFSNIMDQISNIDEIKGVSDLDFRKNENDVVKLYNDSPLYNDILDIVEFSKYISRNVRIFAKTSLTFKDIENSVSNDQSIFTSFLKSLAVKLSDLTDIKKILSSKKSIINDSKIIIQKIKDNGITKEYFYQLPDDEKINIVSG